MGGNQLNVQPGTQAAELALRQLPGQLLLEGGSTRALKDGMAVGVEGERDTVALAKVLQHEEVTRRIFLRTKLRPDDLVRGIVDCRHQGQMRPARFEPG